jgi:hypothetical protein
MAVTEFVVRVMCHSMSRLLPALAAAALALLISARHVY